MRIVLVLIVGLLASLAVLDWVAPEADARRESAAIPLEPDIGDPYRGAQLFQAECARCHGEDLRGTAEGPPLIHPYYRPDHHADIAFFMAIKNGVVQHHWDFGNMPPVPSVKQEQARDIVTFVRKTQRQAGLFESQ